MTRIAILAAAIALSGCSTINTALTSAGASSTIVADTPARGQLACQANGAWMLVAGANVVGAASSAVAAVCAAAAPGAVPGAVPGGTVAKIVTVGNDVLSVLAASKAAGL